MEGHNALSLLGDSFLGQPTHTHSHTLSLSFYTEELSLSSHEISALYEGSLIALSTFQRVQRTRGVTEWNCDVFYREGRERVVADSVHVLPVPLNQYVERLSFPAFVLERSNTVFHRYIL